MPDDATTDHSRQVHFVGETPTVLLVGEEIDGQRQATPGQDRHQTVVAERADQAIERHGGDMSDDRAECQTEAAVGGQQRITGALRSHPAVAQDEVREDREHGSACRALDAPDAQTTQPDPHIMGVAGQAPAAATGRLVCELKAKGQEKGEHAFDKRLPIAQELKGGRFVSKIDSDGAVFAGPFGGLPHVSPPGYRVSSAAETQWEEHVAISRPLGRAQGVTTKSDECGQITSGLSVPFLITSAWRNFWSSASQRPWSGNAAASVAVAASMQARFTTPGARWLRRFSFGVRRRGWHVAPG